MDRVEEARAYLERDPVLHANLLEILRRGSADQLVVEPEGVLLHDGGCGAWMLAAEGAAAERLLDQVPPDCDLFVGHNMGYFSLARTRLGLREQEICWSAAYLRPEPPPVRDFDGALRMLDLSQAPWVLEHYSHAFADLTYMERAIERGMIGAFVRGMPAGFVGYHDEGSIGMLEVLPRYRRRGLGEVLQRAAIGLALARGQFPFAHIIAGNVASLALPRKLGMERSKTPLFWLMGKPND